VTSLPIIIRPGEEPLVIGHHPDAPGAFGERMLVSEIMSRKVPDGVPNDAVALVDAFAVGQFYVRTSGIKPGELPLVIGAGAIGLSAVAALKARDVSPIVIADYSEDRLSYAQRFGADVLVNPSSRDPYEVWRETFRANNFQTTQVIFECVGKNGLMQNIVDSCEFMARVHAAGGWYDAGTVDCTAATHKGVTIQFGGGPLPQDWYGTLDAVVAGRLDPLPSVGRTIGLDEVPEAIDQVRKGQGPPRVVVHPGGS
jgi:threonine dehydrogenase-like Zn-dependent dehydrogenase